MAFGGGGLSTGIIASAAQAETDLAEVAASITGADGNINMEAMLLTQKAVMDYSIITSTATNLIKGEGDPFKDAARNLGG